MVNRVAAYQWLCCGVNTAEQKKLCLYTGSSFPIRYINFKINFVNFLFVANAIYLTAIDSRSTFVKIKPSVSLPTTWINSKSYFYNKNKGFTVQRRLHVALHVMKMVLLNIWPLSLKSKVHDEPTVAKQTLHCRRRNWQ